MSKALSTVGSLPFLAEAWKHLFANSRRRSRDARGLDGKSINSFKADERANLRLIADSVRRESYTFSLLSPHVLDKPDGGFRIICVPTVADRIVQRALVNFMTTRYMMGGNTRKTRKLMNPVSYGFVCGRKVRDAIEMACAMRASHPWVYKTDIASFFDQIPREELHVAIRRHVTEESLHPLLVAASECEVDDSKPSNRRALAEKKIRRGVGVRQGMPLSPVFANILMIEFDRSLARRHVMALRYADDLIFFGSSEAECLRYHELCKDMLAELGLTVPDIGLQSKSRVYGPGAVAEFLGLGIAWRDGAYRAVVTSKQIHKMRDKFLTLGDVDSLNSRGISFAAYGNMLAATAEGYRACYDYAHNYEEVDDCIEEFREMALGRLVTQAFHCDVRDLEPRFRTFFNV